MQYMAEQTEANVSASRVAGQDDVLGGAFLLVKQVLDGEGCFGELSGILSSWRESVRRNGGGNVVAGGVERFDQVKDIRNVARRCREDVTPSCRNVSRQTPDSMLIAGDCRPIGKPEERLSGRDYESATYRGTKREDSSNCVSRSSSTSCHWGER